MSAARRAETLKRALASIFRDRRGAVAIWAALIAPVLLGVAALAVDVSRLYNLDAELQTAADALARAGAVELDGRSDSIDRATAAISNLVVNDQRFSDAGRSQVGVDHLTFLTSIPSNDDTPIDLSAATADPALARFVQVVVRPEHFTSILPPQVATGLAHALVRAEAVGGRTGRICNAAPLFVCDPYEGDSQTLATALENRAVRGRLVALKSVGGGGTYYPGNFGYLDPPNGGGASDMRDLFAQSHPATCFDQRGVTMRTGAVSSVSQGLNVRFDMYDGPLSGKKGDPEYAPALNVTKGYAGAKCNSSPDVRAMALPRDACFASGNCPYLDGRMGDGAWDVVSYMQVNHGAPATASIAGVTYSFNYATHTVSPQPRPTRYEVYRWEIESGRIPGQSGYSASTTPEVGTPRCYSGGVLADEPDRRVISVAVLQCRALDAQYGISGGSTPPLPTSGFAKVFITEPMGSGPDDAIWGEIVGLLGNGLDSQSHDQIEVRR
jgi:Flp pilus assembly protein TadG